ncbi:SRPBCC family protein [Aquimarina mytili]|uniref:SRPBCC family protein n=1 Tax=Aquimarina mytili TaxID=874423 RepID=A0A937A059_9FLAO|nr:SRPBCC family protein [Aquimarina mytili]MBL0685095.1 SRPBCC family protein [Aquimarina mytili]
MTTIHLKTIINSSIKKVFDLSRNIDFHVYTASKTKEQAIEGTISGLIGLDETVTWRGKHFGLYLTHRSKITSFDSPNRFTDEMIQGHFKYFKHEHIFHRTSKGTEMIDILRYETPYGIFGKAFNHVFLKKYLTHFLISRNQFIKSHLEMCRP